MAGTAESLPLTNFFHELLCRESLNQRFEIWEERRLTRYGGKSMATCNTTPPITHRHAHGRGVAGWPRSSIHRDTVW
jgi:hypothetical protein